MQANLISCANALGYNVDEKGICFGVAHMGMQAILAMERVKFEERYQLINDIVEKAKIATENDKQKEINDEIRAIINKLPAEKRVDLLSFFDGVVMYQYPGRFFRRLGIEVDSTEQSEAVSEVLSIVSPKKLVNSTKPITVLSQEISRFSDACYLKELEQYFNMLEEILNQEPKCNYPFAMELDSAFHSIVIAYDPSGDEGSKWVTIDANSLFTEPQSSGELAYNIQAGFDLSGKYTRNPCTVFTCQNVFVSADNKTDLENRLAKWRSSSKWQEKHQMTKKKCYLKDASNMTLLNVAARTGDLKLAKEFLELVEYDDPILYELGDSHISKLSALGMAFQENHNDIAIEILKKVRPEKAMDELYSGIRDNSEIAEVYKKCLNYISDDIFHKHYDKHDDPNRISALVLMSFDPSKHQTIFEITEMYLKKGVDPNNYDQTHPSLYKAITYGSPKMAELLLKHGAKAHLDDYNFLYLAIKTNQPEIVKLLLKYGADPNLSDSNIMDNTDNAYSFARTQNNQEIIKLLKEYAASLTPVYQNTAVNFFQNANNSSIIETKTDIPLDVKVMI